RNSRTTMRTILRCRKRCRRLIWAFRTLNVHSLSYFSCMCIHKCRSRLDISTPPKWLEHIQYRCTMRAVPMSERLYRSNKGESVNDTQKARKTKECSVGLSIDNRVKRTTFQRHR